MTKQKGARANQDAIKEAEKIYIKIKAMRRIYKIFQISWLIFLFFWLIGFLFGIIILLYAALSLMLISNMGMFISIEINKMFINELKLELGVYET
jgi:hypothetical protein